MDFLVRRLIKMSLTLRKLAFSQAQRVIAPRFFNLSQLHKDKVNKCDIKSSKKEDLMLKTLQQGLSPSHLLNYIDSNKDQIRREHVIAVLSSLHNFFQENSQDHENVDEQIDFAKLCECMNSQIKLLYPAEIIEALNILHLLNVPSSNIFIMTLLNHLEESAEKLSFQDIYKLSVLLEKFVPTNLSQSIDSAIKNQFYTKLSQIEENDIPTLIYASCYAFRNVKDNTILNILSNTLENYKKDIELKDALNILNIFFNIQDLPYKFTNIIRQVQSVLIDNIDDLKPDQILQIVRGTSLKITANQDEFYNETLYIEIVQKVIYENWNFLQANDILFYLNSIRHVQMDLVDYLSAKCYEDLTIFNYNAELLYPLVKGLALADYKPVFWDVIREPIQNIDISTLGKLELCKFALYLACLECFEPIILEEVFSTEECISEEHQQILLRLYQIVKVLCPSYKGPWPSKDIMDSLKNLQQNKHFKFPLLYALEEAIGGNIYIKSNVRTTLEHYIDHVVIMNRGGYPIAVNSFGSVESKSDSNRVTYLEDLAIPPGSQIFLILYAQPNWYARNTERMLGPYSLFIKTLESMSYTVISVNGKMWRKMSENERKSYVMQAIKLKFEDDSVSTTS